MAALATDQNWLLERGPECDAIEQRIDDACDGRGSIVVLHGPAGIGKTRLLEHAGMRAGARGMQVLSARGSELEQDFPFGIVRQLFEPELAGLNPEERARMLSGAASPAAALFNGGEQAARSGPEALFSILHGLYWLCANLATSGAVALSVDDAHWADASSLRWLQFLVRRLEGLPVLVIVALRSEEPGGDSDAVEELRYEPGALHVQPRPLSAGAVAELVRAEVAEDADDDFCAACYEATGGVPFLVSELIATLAAEGEDAELPAPEEVLALGTASVSRSVLHRLAHLPAEARALTRGLAVLSGGAELSLVANLAEVDHEAAIAAAGSLARCQIVSGAGRLSFVHPLVHSSVRESLPRAERARMHARAARLLAERGGGTDAVALHLLAADPAGDPWIVGWLRRAASHAAASGAVDEACTYLRRALAEPPSSDELPVVLHELGVAEATSYGTEAEEHLNAAFEGAASPRARAMVALDLGRALILRERPEAAIDACDRGLVAAREEGDRELALRLEAEAITAATQSFDRGHLATPRADRLLPEVRGAETPAERLVLAGIAWERAVSASVPAAAVVEMAERALAGGDLLSLETPEALTFYVAAAALAVSDKLAAAETQLTDALAAGRRARSVGSFAMASCWRAVTAYRRGALTQAEDDARRSLDIAAEHGWAMGGAVSLAMLLECLTARGQLAEAQDALARWPESALPGSTFIGPLLVVRGKVRALSGSPEAALEDFRSCGRVYAAAEIRNPALGTWRSSAARVLAPMGETGEAQRLVAEELEIARAYGAPRNIGVALRAAALVTEDPRRRTELLREAVGVLEGSEARLEHARALVSLGESLSAGGSKVEAREPLRQALDLSHRCGATALGDTARRILIAAGARPRRLVLTGRDSLTPSELRIARLAAQGLTNREIAEQQFLTLRMVEIHLTRSYRKLGISSRAELPRELDEGGSERATE